MALELVPEPCRHCGRTEGITTVGGMKRHENACKANPASRSSGANPDTVAIRVQKAANDAITDARNAVQQARSLLSDGTPPAEVLPILDKAVAAFTMHDAFVKLLEA